MRHGVLHPPWIQNLRYHSERDFKRNSTPMGFICVEDVVAAPAGFEARRFPLQSSLRGLSSNEYYLISL